MSKPIVANNLSNTATGIFNLEDLPKEILTRRAQILERRDWFEAPSEVVEIDGDKASPVAIGDIAAKHLSTAGAVIIKNDHPLAPTQLLDLASSLGTLIEDDSPQQYREGRYIANVRQDLPASSDVSMQPFSENYITFHTEHSYLPAAQQPRYLLFSCLSAPSHDSGGQTLLRSSEQVVKLLSQKSREILNAVSYASTNLRSDAATFVRIYEGQQTICFRDYDLSGIHWMGHWPSNAHMVDDVRRALSELFAAIYEPQAISGIHWQRGDIWIIDNFRYLHGKTFYPAAASPSSRWLQRILVRTKS